MYLRVFWWYLFLTLDVSTVAISNNQSPHSFEEGFPQGQAMWPGTVVEGRKTAQKAFIEFFGEIPQSDLDSLGYYCRICKGCNSFAEYYRLCGGNVTIRSLTPRKREREMIMFQRVKESELTELEDSNDSEPQDSDDSEPNNSNDSKSNNLDNSEPKDSDNNSEPKNSDDSELKDFDDSEPKDSDNLELEDSNDSEPKDSNENNERSNMDIDKDSLPGGEGQKKDKDIDDSHLGKKRKLSTEPSVEEQERAKMNFNSGIVIGDEHRLFDYNWETFVDFTLINQDGYVLKVFKNAVKLVNTTALIDGHAQGEKLAPKKHAVEIVQYWDWISKEFPPAC
ncbi:hypothetical protein GGU11DRAFT_760332 [Lentinula aff. detonsa]|nr:hypothetical protein GGU11DRAFT_760332 [Lentinula aff. detonsa]